MHKNNQNKVASPATTVPTPMNRIGHWGRVAVMCVSAGFIFPNAITENDDDIVEHAVYNEDSGKKE
jgi:hypothetical protein